MCLPLSTAAYAKGGSNITHSLFMGASKGMCGSRGPRFSNEWLGVLHAIPVGPVRASHVRGNLLLVLARLVGGGGSGGIITVTRFCKVRVVSQGGAIPLAHFIHEVYEYAHVGLVAEHGEGSDLRTHAFLYFNGRALPRREA